MPPHFHTLPLIFNSTGPTFLYFPCVHAPYLLVSLFSNPAQRQSFASPLPSKSLAWGLWSGAICFSGIPQPRCSFNAKPFPWVHSWAFFLLINLLTLDFTPCLIIISEARQGKDREASHCLCLWCPRFSWSLLFPSKMPFSAFKWHIYFGITGWKAKMCFYVFSWNLGKSNSSPVVGVNTMSSSYFGNGGGLRTTWRWGKGESKRYRPAQGQSFRRNHGHLRGNVLFYLLLLLFQTGSHSVDWLTTHSESPLTLPLNARINGVCQHSQF